MSAAGKRRAAPEDGWGSLTVADLQEELETRELTKSGNKAELVARLEEDDAASGAGAAPEEAEREPGAGEGEPDRPEAEDDEGEPARRRRRSAETSTATARKAAPRSTDGAVVVRARARYVRSAPRKARLVMAHIRGKPVEQARAILGTAPRAVSVDILKLLNSAVANAESNYELAADELRIDRAFVDEGPTIKRYRPRALGRATRINKRTSHMTITLTTTEGE
jgi:large subunit ribosomal protein L22